MFVVVVGDALLLCVQNLQIRRVLITAPSLTSRRPSSPAIRRDAGLLTWPLSPGRSIRGAFSSSSNPQNWALFFGGFWMNLLLSRRPNVSVPCLLDEGDNCYKENQVNASAQRYYISDAKVVIVQSYQSLTSAITPPRNGHRTFTKSDYCVLS